MGWSTELFCNVSYNKETFNSRGEVEDKISDSLPASYLQMHQNATVCVDLPTAAHLTRIQRPCQ